MKRISYLLILLIGLAAVGCSTDKPWVGEWIPDSGNQDGVMIFRSDGTAIYDQKSSDGTVYVEGTWSPVEGSENTFSVEFAPSTVKASSDNSIVTMFLREAGKALASQISIGTVSEDGESLRFQGGNGGYIRK